MPTRTTPEGSTPAPAGPAVGGVHVMHADDTPARRALEEFKRAGQHGRVLTLAEKQRVRMHRFKIAALTTALATVIVGCFAFVGKLDLEDFLRFVSGSALLAVFFFWLFRSGNNLKFRDPSLTLPMMVSALGMLLYAMSRAKGSHELISILYVLPFVFGTLRLNTRQLLTLAAATLLVDLLLAVFDRYRLAGEAHFQLELLRWIALAVVLMWLSVMAGFISSLRADLAETNRKLGSAIETIRHMATHDELTGVFNRRHLVDVLAAEEARSLRYGSAWSVCLVDVDFFKRVNDTLGHAAGDHVLRGFATAVQRAKRPTDAFGRYGGEEFLLVLAQTSLGPAQVTAERIRAIAEATAYEGLDPDLRITVSIGVAEYRPEESWRETVERADRALYLAKQSGRNRVEADDGRRPMPARGRGLAA